MINFSSIPSYTLTGRLFRSFLRIIPEEAVIPIFQGRLKGKKWIKGSGVNGYWLGIVTDTREPSVTVNNEFGLKAGEAEMISTYVGGTPEPQAPQFKHMYEILRRVPLHGETPEELAKSMFYSIDQDYVVCAASGVWMDEKNRWELAVRNKI